MFPFPFSLFVLYFLYFYFFLYYLFERRKKNNKGAVDSLGEEYFKTATNYVTENANLNVVVIIIILDMLFIASHFNLTLYCVTPVK